MGVGSLYCILYIPLSTQVHAPKGLLRRSTSLISETKVELSTGLCHKFGAKHSSSAFEFLRGLDLGPASWLALSMSWAAVFLPCRCHVGAGYIRSLFLRSTTAVVCALLPNFGLAERQRRLSHSAELSRRRGEGVMGLGYKTPCPAGPVCYMNLCTLPIRSWLRT